MPKGPISLEGALLGSGSDGLCPRKEGLGNKGFVVRKLVRTKQED